jgi:integrase/recombinase XerD
MGDITALPKRRLSQNAPSYLTEKEIDDLFRVIKSPRDRALFRVAYHRGLRASEVGILKLSDYRPAPVQGRLYVHRLKGSISREYLITEIETAALKTWLRIRGPIPGPLFVSRNHRAISSRRLDHLMKRYCARAGIAAEKAHMHAPKHSCGTHLVDRKGPDLYRCGPEAAEAGLGPASKVPAQSFGQEEPGITVRKRTESCSGRAESRRLIPIRVIECCLPFHALEGYENATLVPRSCRSMFHAGTAGTGRCR